MQAFLKKIMHKKEYVHRHGADANLKKTTEFPGWQELNRSKRASYIKIGAI